MRPLFEHDEGDPNAGDDDLGTIAIPFTETQIALEVFKPFSEECGIRHKFFTMHQGQTSTYKTYFDVQIAGFWGSLSLRFSL